MSPAGCRARVMRVLIFYSLSCFPPSTVDTVPHDTASGGIVVLGLQLAIVGSNTRRKMTYAHVHPPGR